MLGTKVDAMRKLGRSITGVFVGNSIDKMGNRQGNMRGAPAAGVAWPVDPTTHDGMSFIASDAFFAEYDSDKKEVWCLDDIGGTRHTGANPLRVGKNVEIANGEKRSGRGLVVRTAEYGTDGLAKNVFIHVDGDLIAHHRQPDPPKNSSLVHDPGEGADDWAGGLHYPLRVRKWIEQFCQSATTSSDQQLYAPLFNLSRNGDGTVAHGAAHWGRGEGCLSDEAFGPLAPCDDGARHRIGHTGDATVYEAGLNIGTTKLGDPAAGIVYSPVEFDKTPRVPDGGGPFWMHTHFREDMQLKHGTLCNGEQPGTKIWQTPTMFTEWGPPPREPEVPPPRQPEDDSPPGVPIFPTPEEFGPAPPLPDTGSPGNKGPQDGSSTSAATPAEVESPSEYGHPLPTGPEKPELGRKGTADDQEWLDRYGVTLKEFAESPITSHAINTAVYESATANDNATGARRWPTVKSQEAIVIYDADGRVVGRRQPAKGPGGVMYAPSDVEKPDLYTTINPISDTARNAFYLGVFSAAHSGGKQVADGEIGLGSLKPDVTGIVKGWRFRLDFSRLSDPANPDLYLNQIDEEGATSTTGKFYVNGSEVGAGGTLASMLTSDEASSTTTMANSALSLTVAAGGWYALDAELQVSAELNAGFKFDIDGGTATMTGMLYTVVKLDTTGTAGQNVLSSSVAALATDVTVGSSTLSCRVTLRGYVNVNVGGTFILRFSRVGASGSASLGAGSWIRLMS